MKKSIDQHKPCPDCGSKDARAEYEDGYYCFSCGTSTKKVGVNTRKDLTSLSESGRIYHEEEEDNKVTGDWLVVSNDYQFNSTTNTSEFNSTSQDSRTNMNYTYDYLNNNFRGINKSTYETYKAKVRIINNEPYAIEFPYSPNNYKVRLYKEKKFFSEGDYKNFLFGVSLFDPGSAKYITITEGEFDCLAAYQMLGSKYPCVSVRGSSSARADCEAHWKYLNSFENIVICFDNDEPGKKAAKAVAGLFDVNKVKIVELSQFKDANDYLKANKDADFVKAWWAAKAYLPKGIVGQYSEIEAILSKEDAKSIAEYPWPTINEMSYGIRSKEIVLLTAQEKVGKTEVMGAIEHHLLKTTDYNLGIIHLEEPEKRAIQRLIGYELNKPIHLPDSTVSVADAFSTYQQLTKKEGRLYFYSHFGSDDPDTILDAIRYLVVACHCKFIFLDHITMLVTGYEGDDERRKLDYISTRLAMMTRELDFCLFLVSHVNDEGKTRGSRNISKIADLLVHLDRDITAESDVVRNTTNITIRGNRFASKSGPAGKLIFDPQTYKLGEQEHEFRPLEAISS